MDYWETVVKEIQNRNDKSYRFVYTNVGERDSEYKTTKHCLVGNKKRERKMYFLGEKYKGIYFTQREAECLVHLLKGATIVSAAASLGLSPRTVEFYVKNMKLKLNCATKAELLEKVRETDFLKNLDEEKIFERREVEE